MAHSNQCASITVTAGCDLHLHVNSIPHSWQVIDSLLSKFQTNIRGIKSEGRIHYTGLHSFNTLLCDCLLLLTRWPALGCAAGHASVSEIWFHCGGK